MHDYLLRLAVNNPHGTNWAPLVTVHTSHGRTLQAQMIGAVDPHGFSQPGVRVHARSGVALQAGEIVDGIDNGGDIGRHTFWPVVHTELLH